jgi:predicted acetyltransferase
VLRTVAAEEFDVVVDLLEMAAGRHPTAQARQDALAAYPLDRTWGVYDGGRLVGATSSDRLAITVPGGGTPVAVRPTLAAVTPTARGRGHATALLSHQLADFAARKEPIAIATTSTPGLLTRVGYAPANVAVEMEVDTAYVRVRADTDDVDVHSVDAVEAKGLVPRLFDEHRRRQPGQVLRTDGFWSMWWLDRELYRIGPGPRFFLLAQDAQAVPRGYLTYRLAAGDLREQPVLALVVEDLIATTDAARRALWRFCLSFSQVRRVAAYNVAMDEPVRWLLRDSRGLRVTRARDFLWMRLVDVPAALTTRSYGADDDLRLEVRDDLLPANAGRWCLEARSAEVACTRTASGADLALDVSDLAAAYLGGTSLRTLAAAGRIEERRDGAIARADALFAIQPAPWTVTDW